MQQIPMTATGVEKLREELKHLKTVVRPRIIAAIAEARGHGDLKENAEYHAAKEQQSFTEGRIRDIEDKLSRVQVIDISGMANNGKVVFSATVTLVNLDTEQTMIYQIVGEEEADLKAGKISVTSPIARAVIGKHEGDTVEVTAPGGVVSYEISEVIY
ncbi:MAG TPA: transcription elongation factor GreA [Gammaproteobacteria bacterium]|nr:transcription elongation factor GreA [Gammaproteobacteria bacterium]